jgi:hypothetical protein
MAMRFIKIKAMTDEGKDKIYIEYENPNGSNFDSFVIKSNDKAAPSFYEALQGLGKDVVDMCEFQDSDIALTLVRGVSFSYGGDDDTMGATITATKKLLNSNAPLNINTPHKAEKFYSGSGDPKQLLDPDCVRRLKVLIEEAAQFVGGVRAQLDVFAKAA